MLHARAHRSWSGIGSVEARAGDVITVNPGEMHDGDPVCGEERSWRMLYLDPELVARVLLHLLRGDTEIARPVVRDPILVGRFVREEAIQAGLTDAETFDAGIRGLLRTAEPDGVFCYTFFKATGFKASVTE